MASWYYAVGSQTQGPISEDELQAMARRGELTPASYVVREGESVWQTLSEVESSLGLAASASGGYLDQATSGGGDAGQATTWGGPPPGQQPGWAAPGQPGQAGWSSEPQPQAWGQPPTDPYGASVPGQYGAAPGQYDAGVPGQYGGLAPGQYGAPAPGQYTPWSGAAAPGQFAGYDGYGTAPVLAGWWQRVGASLLDTLVLVIPMLIILLILYSGDMGQLSDGNSFQAGFTGRRLAGGLLTGLLQLAYSGILNGRGQTVGKMALGIKVVNADTGAPIGMGKGFLRHTAQFVAGLVPCPGALFLLLDVLWPLWDDRNQALHDKIAGSIVVKTR